jgi:hypothetical protein
MRDVALVARMQSKTPFTIPIVLLWLALGIGANTAIFSTFDQPLSQAPRPTPGSNPCNETVRCDEGFSYTRFRNLGRARTAWPIQVRAQVPYEPTAFLSEGSHHLFYELYLTNFSQSPIALNGVEVIDWAAPNAPALARFTGGDLDAIVQGIGGNVEEPGKPHLIRAGGTLALFLEVKVPDGRPLPKQLAHRLQLGDGIVTTATIGTRLNVLKVLGRPVSGTDWLAADGPGNDSDNHHRRGIFIRSGRLTNSRRLAIDWKIVKDGKSYQGDEHATVSYFAHGKPLLAVADAVVVAATDGLPDNPPGHGADFHPAMPITFDNAGGNHVVLDLGNGQYGHYFHMRSGSLRVKTGDHVRRGQVIGAIGSSGDAREPHVHLEITNAIELFGGEGIPYVIDHYRVMTSRTGQTGPRERQLPLDGMTIDFGR